MKHRARRSLRSAAVVAGASVAGVTMLGVPFLWSDAPPPEAEQGAAAAASARPVAAPLSKPTVRPRPRYLTRSYRAPAALVRPGAGGTLRIPSLDIDAPVDAVGLDGTAMAIPNDPARVGWLTTTAHAGDAVGASVLAGHVSDEQDQPGALNRLARIRLGASIIWTDQDGRRAAYRIVRIKLFPRSRGLPVDLFSAVGRSELNLVTCAMRVTTANGGFHYSSNLVVTAVR